MQALLMALLFATATSHGGNLYIHTLPGLQILIDGMPAGTSTNEDGGKFLKNIATGPHHVIVRTDDGREASFNVAITEGLTSDVNVSPLGFRKLNRSADIDESSVVRVTSIPANSIVEIYGMARQNNDGTELTFDAVAPGTHRLTVTHAGTAIRGDVVVPKSSVVTVNVDAAKAAITTTETKARPRRLQVNDPNDALRMLNIPSQWKTAIRSALPATVSILDAYSEGNAVKVRLKVPSDDMAEALLESLERSSAFADVRFGSRPHREQAGWIVDFIFYFAG